jgi:transposase
MNVALPSVIRQWHVREQVSIRAIARGTGLSRNTVRSNLDEFTEKLAGWLKTEAAPGRKQTNDRKRAQEHPDRLKISAAQLDLCKVQK